MLDGNSYRYTNLGELQLYEGQPGFEKGYAQRIKDITGFEKSLYEKSQTLYKEDINLGLFTLPGKDTLEKQTSLESFLLNMVYPCLWF